MDSRKQIEREMERFKICEKETKTKAFSKEGLGQQPKTDPKEKAKSETRDWLNNVVSELENQIDSFEAEIEGLSVKKGKTRPPRLTHLETSITRHKAHIMKLELILRLLDNDELSPEQVNDVKDFLDDYVERNQEDFEEFDDVDELYSSLPLDKVELEDLIPVGPPGLVKITSALDQTEEAVSQEYNSEPTPRTPPSKSTPAASSTPTTPAVTHTTPGPTTPIPPPVVTTNLSGPAPNSPAAMSSPSHVSSSTKEEEMRKSTPALSGRGALLTNQPPPAVPVLSNGAVPSASEIAKRNMLVGEERVGGAGVVQPSLPLVSPLSNRMVMSQGPGKGNDVTNSNESGNLGEATSMVGRAFSPSAVPGIQWRPGGSFQNQTEAGQYRGRTEIPPDQREKFLQKYTQVQQQGGQSPLLGMPPLSGAHKHFTAQQQTPLLQQFNAQSSVITPQIGMAAGAQPPGLNNIAAANIQQQQQPNSIHQQSSQIIPAGPKGVEAGLTKVEELQQQQSMPDELAKEASSSASVGKNPMNDDDIKPSYVLDTPTGIAGAMTESTQGARDKDLLPSQPLQQSQPSGSLGVIGRRSVSDLGTIGDSLGQSSPLSTSNAMHDQLHNLQMLEAAYYKLPQPKDSERPKTYTPRHPAATPVSYPQVQAPIVNNPAFWERLGTDNFGTDTLFFAFYYQQNTYQQYLAAKELKKQSWRYHKKYNTWFQRHEEPKVATDDYEQGTYVYFDFHIGNDELQHGWCQRIKTEFRFEYNFLEDELIV
jgi:CCR4-NOT transcription complex subunit 3